MADPRQVTGKSPNWYTTLIWARLLLLMIEGLKGSPLSLRVQTALTYAGLVLIVGLLVGLTCMDVAHVLG